MLALIKTVSRDICGLVALELRKSEPRVFVTLALKYFRATRQLVQPAAEATSAAVLQLNPESAAAAA